MDMRFFTDYFGVRVGVERYEQLEKYVVCRVQVLTLKIME